MTDLVGAIIAYEQGDLDDLETVELFQHLIDTGLAWSFQGHYGRTAKAFIDAGECQPPGRNPLTKKHFERMAEIVRAIKDGQWTNEYPSWVSDASRWQMTPELLRSIQTAEAFIILARQFNPLFDTERFLKACGFEER